MSIAPPDNGFKRDTLASSSLKAPMSRYEEELLAKRKAYLASPEGQAAQAAEKKAEEAYDAEMMSLYAKMGILSTTDEEGSEKKCKKHHAKHPPQKKTGFLNGLTAKLGKKK